MIAVSRTDALPPQNGAADEAEKLIFNHIKFVASTLDDSTHELPAQVEVLVAGKIDGWFQSGRLERAVRVWESVVGGALGRRFRLRRETLAALHLAICWHGDRSGSEVLAKDALPEGASAAEASAVTEWLLLMRSATAANDDTLQTAERLVRQGGLSSNWWMFVFFADTYVNASCSVQLIDFRKIIARTCSALWFAGKWPIRKRF